MSSALHLRSEGGAGWVWGVRRGVGCLILLAIFLLTGGRALAQGPSAIELISYDQRTGAWVTDDATSFYVVYKCSIVRLSNIWPSHSCMGEVRMRNESVQYSGVRSAHVAGVESVYRSGARFSVGGRVVELVGFDEWAKKALTDEKERVRPQLIQEFLSVGVVLGLLALAAMLIWSLLIKFLKDALGFFTSLSRPKPVLKYGKAGGSGGGDGDGQMMALGYGQKAYPSVFSVRVKGLMLTGLGGVIWVVGIPLSVAWIAFCFSNIVIGVLMLFLLPPVLLGPILFSVFGGLKFIVFGLAMLLSRY